MYNELFKRQPHHGNGVDAATLNEAVNTNFKEVFGYSDLIRNGEPDVGNRHKAQGINGFDTRRVTVYNGKMAFNADFSVGKLTDGSDVAYAKNTMHAICL